VVDNAESILVRNAHRLVQLDHLFQEAPAALVLVAEDLPPETAGDPAHDSGCQFIELHQAALWNCVRRAAASRTMLQILRTDATVADSTRPLIGVSWSVNS